MKKKSSGNATIQAYVPALTGRLTHGALSIPVLVTQTKRAYGRILYLVHVPGSGTAAWIASGLVFDPPSPSTTSSQPVGTP